MNGKKAKALRRLEKALEQEKLAFQEMLRRSTPVPVKTLSMDEFNKARAKATEQATLATEAAETATVNHIQARRENKASSPIPSEEELDRMHASMNGPEAYGKIGSMGNNPLYRVSDACGDRGVVCRVDPDVPVDSEGHPADIVIFGKDRFKPSSFKDKE